MSCLLVFLRMFFVGCLKILVPTIFNMCCDDGSNFPYGFVSGCCFFMEIARTILVTTSIVTMLLHNLPCCSFGLVKIPWCFFQAATAEVVNGPPMKTWRLGPSGGFNGGLNGNQ